MNNDQNSLFRALPSVDHLLHLLVGPTNPKGIDPELQDLPRELLRLAVTDFLDEKRLQIRQGEVRTAEDLHSSQLFPALLEFVTLRTKPHFRRVLNATGVVIHTNLGRSLLAPEAAKAVQDACLYYSNLEFDLETGGRGSRYSHVEELLCQLTGAEAAMVVNNNAAAVLLVLDTLCKGKEVVVSRGELVEIGGSFRIPEVMERSGCILKETGSTNRTHEHDYANAINEHTAALMKVHTSNFTMKGFVKSLDREAMCSLAKKHGILCIEDLGSGCLFDFSKAGLPALGAEPSVQQVVKSGMDIVTLSGDKVLGGPQAGIILGSKSAVGQIKANQLTRALRIDKMTLAALEATLRLYLDPQKAQQSIPTLRMLLYTEDELAKRARRLAQIMKKHLSLADLENTVTLKRSAARVGGGSFPELDLPAVLVAVSCSYLQHVRQSLLNAPLPLVGRVEEDMFCLDPRTLSDEEFVLAAKALAAALVATRL